MESQLVDFLILDLMLTAKTMEEYLLNGLHLGADDYMTKPFSLKELYARTEAISRRTAGDLKPLARPKKIFTRNDLILTAMTGSLTPISKTSEKKWRIKDFSDNLAAGLSDQYDAETGKWNLDYIIS